MSERIVWRQRGKRRTRGRWWVGAHAAEHRAPPMLWSCSSLSTATTSASSAILRRDLSRVRCSSARIQSLGRRATTGGISLRASRGRELQASFCPIDNFAPDRSRGHVHSDTLADAHNGCLRGGLLALFWLRTRRAEESDERGGRRSERENRGALLLSHCLCPCSAKALGMGVGRTTRRRNYSRSREAHAEPSTGHTAAPALERPHISGTQSAAATRRWQTRSLVASLQ